MKPAPDTNQSAAMAPERVPVLIAGGGPVGLSLAALLGRFGVRCVVIEADASYCSGSRAICISRRSQEIFGWFGADRDLLDKGLPWTGGRSFFRDAQVLHFQMPSDARQRFAPMLNIQQFYVEEYAHRAAAAAGSLVEVRWSSRVTGLQPHAQHVDVHVEAADGTLYTLRADWLVACDGGRSTVREQSGLAFEGMQYEGRYVIVDIEQDTQRPVERLAWFDPPSNPGSTILMHRQPDNVWRIDYQIGDDEDAIEAVKPEKVLPRVQSHLQMIGETAPWKPLWISIYNAKCLTLERYRQGRVLFAGDAAHLVPIFGVRGLNSGLDDAGNLAWKLALVIQGQAHAELLDSYSAERVHATRENIAYGAKSTEFMAPPHFGFKLMREAALRLAVESAPLRSLINPRQSAPIRYEGAALNAASPDAAQSPRAGDPAPEALLGTRHLSQLFGRGFVALYFSDAPELPAELLHLQSALRDGPGALEVWRIVCKRAAQSGQALFDEAGEAWSRYQAHEGCIVIVRPDAYVLGRWAVPRLQGLHRALDRFRQGECGRPTGAAATRAGV